MMRDWWLAKLLKELSGLTQRDAGREVGFADGSGYGHLLKIAEQRLDGSRKL
jgi:hypothetical protein